MQKLVITVHGIRTFGQWQERLEGLVRARKPEVVFENYHYGYFSVISFLVPIFRWLATRSFRKHLLRLIEKHPDAEVSIVSHSFGTHLVGWGLLGIAPDRRPRIRNVILAGSVLKSGFPWSKLLDSNRVGQVVNDCGINDRILVLSQVCVLFTGMAGRLGFTGMTSERFVNRFHIGGHSHYFENAGSHSNQFMEHYWLPLLLGSTDPQRVDNRKTPGVLDGVLTVALQIADPIKLLIYVGFAWWLLEVAFLAPYRLQVNRADLAEVGEKLVSAQLDKEKLVRKLAENKEKEARTAKELAESKTKTATANAALNALKARNTQAKLEIEQLLKSSAQAKIDKVRALIFDEKALPPKTQLAALSRLEWLAGEYIQSDFDKAVISSEGKAFLDQYLSLLGKVGYTGNILISARVGRPCLAQRAEYEEADPEVDIAQCAPSEQSKAYAQKLSERRAVAVSTYLASKGIPSSKIIYEGRGDKDPVVPYPKEGQAGDWNRVARLNARIDLVLSQETHPK